jgi:hypothetical protein
MTPMALVDSKPHFRHFVVIPVGPGVPREYVADTLESVKHYTGPDRHIVLVDDSGTGAVHALGDMGSDVEIMVNATTLGPAGGLYLSLSRAYQHVFERYTFDVLLRMDTDALITGPHPEEQAIAYFARNSNVGMLGSYRWTCSGWRRDSSWARQRLQIEMTGGNAPATERSARAREPDAKSRVLLRRLQRRAVRNGYEMGESCLGGACYLSYRCVAGLHRNGLLNRDELRGSLLGEDHLYGLMVRAIGMKLADFDAGDSPMCLDWLNLPCSPEEIVRRGKKVVHSTKKWGDWDEPRIRAFFHSARHGTNATGNDQGVLPLPRLSR